MPAVRSEDDDPNKPFDPSEPPPEPPETLNVLEHQRYISKLITGASKPPSANGVARIWSSATMMTKVIQTSSWEACVCSDKPPNHLSRDGLTKFE